MQQFQDFRDRPLLFIDLEMSGLDPTKHEIVEVGALLVDGETRRRKVNVMHLEPLAQVISLGKGASHEAVKTVFGEMGVKLVDTKRKEKKARPLRVRKVKVKDASVKEKAQRVKQKKVAKEEKKKTAESA